MSTEENKAIVRRHFEEVFMGGRVELIDDYYAPDGSTPEMISTQELRELILWWHQAAPGFKLTILDMMAEGDKVMVHLQADVTYSNPMDSLPAEPFLPLELPVSWRVANVFRIVDGKMVAAKYVNNWTQMLIDIGAIPLQKIEQNKAAASKFVDALNRQDASLLAEVCTPEVAKEWVDAFPWIYTAMKDHHIEITDLVADGDGVSARLATCGYHTGELFGLPPTGKWWTNRVFAFFRFADGKIAEVDALPDVENHIKQIGGAIKPV